jgi:hypothetical protein
MVEVEITGVTGTGPYNIYLCDPYFSYCELISGSTIIPPTITFVLEGVFLGLTSFIIKLVDSNGCEIFHPYSCPVTPTPTPTNTPTPTPTSTPGCHCISFENLSTGLTETDSWIIGDSGLGLPSSTYVNYSTNNVQNNIKLMIQDIYNIYINLVTNKFEKYIKSIDKITIWDLYNIFSGYKLNYFDFNLIPSIKNEPAVALKRL